MNRIVVGSTVFFSEYSDFKSKDIDIIKLVKKPNGFENVRQIKLPGKCVFQWRNMSVDEFIEVTLASNLPMSVGKFLVPEFVKKIGFTINDLTKLSSVFDNLDEKHAYEKIIYDAYVENNDFVLTQEQRDLAYAEYKRTRSVDESKSEDGSDESDDVDGSDE